MLANLAVFAIHSRAGVMTSTGLTISRPRPSQVPLDILQIATTGPLTHRAGAGRSSPDLNQIRAVRSRSGLASWIIPGADSFCVATLDHSPLPIESGASGAAEACSDDLANAEKEGEGTSSADPDGASTTYGVLPAAHPSTTIRTGPHTHRTIRPPDGVYITHYASHHT